MSVVRQVESKTAPVHIVAPAFRLPPPDEITAFLSQSLRQHGRHSLFNKMLRDLPRVVREFYAAFEGGPRGSYKQLGAVCLKQALADTLIPQHPFIIDPDPQEFHRTFLEMLSYTTQPAADPNHPYNNRVNQYARQWNNTVRFYLTLIALTQLANAFLVKMLPPKEAQMTCLQGYEYTGYLMMNPDKTPTAYKVRLNRRLENKDKGHQVHSAIFTFWIEFINKGFGVPALSSFANYLIYKVGWYRGILTRYL